MQNQDNVANQLTPQRVSWCPMSMTFEEHQQIMVGYEAQIRLLNMKCTELDCRAQQADRDTIAIITKAQARLAELTQRVLAASNVFTSFDETACSGEVDDASALLWSAVRKLRADYDAQERLVLAQATAIMRQTVRLKKLVHELARLKKRTKR